MNTLDFELEISSGTAGTHPMVARAPGGEVATTMRLPLTSAEIDHHLAVVRDKVLASSAVLRGAPTSDERARAGTAVLGAWADLQRSGGRSGPC